ncbi:hypothetical protein [uncultured Porphyromonas sp.]|uniref:hypothetical protein n=1 Tax=uncultured Porphyromonas sp. TaxID=159274 RepID=UPI00260A5BD4|nr:hypothetical protein [uncultured Porphyromonas sp.]
MEEIENPLVEISDYPVRDGKILRTYDFILPKFYFAPMWRIFIPHGAIAKSLRGA